MVGKQEPLGITLIIPDEADPLPIVDDLAGVAVDVDTAPYLLSDGTSLMGRIPVVEEQDEFHEDAAGKMQKAMAVDLPP